MENILDKICHTKLGEIKEARSKVSYTQIEKLASQASLRTSFHEALINEDYETIRVIAEVKKASPSKGVIDPNFNHMNTARGYVENGAHCLSVLTDKEYFQGAPEYLQEITSEFNIPCLRKDFILDEYQILEAKAWGASAILLIVDCLKDQDLLRLHRFAVDLGLDVLVETHREDEVKRALDNEAIIIGVNNRNLRTFETSLETTFKLREMIPDTHITVSESGISTREDIEKILSHKVEAVLVGESLMRQGSNLLKDFLN